jgi:hypothetical protein
MAEVENSEQWIRLGRIWWRYGQELQSAPTLMGGRGIALGTDSDGLSQIVMNQYRYPTKQGA